MTDLQKCEFNLLKCAIEICKKNGLKYYLVCGSALGAVKYNGFIPWDDDVDIAMSRPDYNIFCEKANELLPEYYFLQNVDTDINFPLISSKMRDIRTTFIETNFKDFDIVHGVYIDIFPLDSFPTDLHSQKRYLKKIRYFERRRSVSIINNFLSGKSSGIRTKFLCYLNKMFRIYENRTEILKKYNSFLSDSYFEGAEIWCNHHEERRTECYHRKEEYGIGENVIFENCSVSIPQLYDVYLTKRYGDWRADLPPEQQVGHHYAEIIDMNRPYTDYIVKLKNGKIRLKTSAELLKGGITPPENYKY